jgi:toxin FitB
VADRWGHLALQQPLLDALLAATALAHDLTVVSGDEDGFRHTGVRVTNPFSRSKPGGN